jgi:hypothetical protein
MKVFTAIRTLITTLRHQTRAVRSEENILLFGGAEAIQKAEQKYLRLQAILASLVVVVYAVSVYGLSFIAPLPGIPEWTTSPIFLACCFYIVFLLLHYVVALPFRPIAMDPIFCNSLEIYKDPLAKAYIDNRVQAGHAILFKDIPIVNKISE